MTSTHAFKIRHSWGDPREPEYKNGLPVSYAYYNEGEIFLIFKVFGIRVKDSTTTDWYLEAPPTTRASLGLRWREHSTIFQRVIDHLTNLEPTASVNFSGITVDASKITGLVPTVFDLVGKRLSTAGLYLPIPYIALTLSIGFLCILANSWNYFPQLNPYVLKAFSFLFGIGSIVQLIQSIQRDYETAKFIAIIPTTANPKFNWRRLALKLIVLRGRWRYTITLTLAFVLVFLALSINA